MLTRAELAIILAAVSLLISFGGPAQTFKPANRSGLPAASPLDAPLLLCADRARTGQNGDRKGPGERIDFEVASLPALGKSCYRLLSVVSRVRAVLDIAAPTLLSSANCLQV